MPLPHIALLRGINVGRGNRVAMADLRAAAESLGYSGVRTLLNSGNLVFRADAAGGHAERLETAFAERLSLRSRVTVLTAAELDQVIAGNPFAAEAEAQPSRLLVSFPRGADALARLAPLADTDWSPERLTVGAHAAYSWHPDGISAGKLAEAIDKAGKDGVTARNWATAGKLREAVR